jgi:3-dehydroquinate dehydratase type I
MILGIITARMLALRRYPAGLWQCDGVELRADGLPPAEIISAVEAFANEKKRRGFQGPVIFTLRLYRDGGAWEDARSLEREVVWLALAEYPIPLCDIVDIEIEEAASLKPDTWEKLRDPRGAMKVILSHHAFVPENEEAWDKQLTAMSAFKPDAVKFAVTLENAEQTKSLFRFARKVARQFPLGCVIGMGETGRTTRIVSPLLGCPITYAFLEGEPVAPGQLSVEVMRACFAYAEGRPGVNGTEEDWIRWAERALQKFSHA